MLSKILLLSCERKKVVDFVIKIGLGILTNCLTSQLIDCITDELNIT